MKITVFSKKISKHDGSKFTGYVTRLNKKDGIEVYCRVRFTGDCQAPRNCPAIITINKQDANMVKRTIVNNDKKYDVYTLWVSNWEPTDEEYIDHSLDEFE